MSFRITVDLSGMEADLRQKAAQFEDVARPAAQAGAQVIYNAVRANVARLKQHSGKLAAAIYQAYSQDNSTRGRAVYHVSWNYRKAPHGHLVEYGHLQVYEVSFDKATGRFVTHVDRPLPQPKLVAARPFVRPAADKAPQAEQAMEQRLMDELSKRGVIE